MSTGPWTAPRTNARMAQGGSGYSADPVLEQLSAWLDDELPVDQLELLIAQVGRQPARFSSAVRYRLIGDCLRGAPPALPALDLSERVARQIESGGASRPESGRPVWRYLPATAAAGLVAVALLLVQKPGVEPRPAAVPTAMTAPASGRLRVAATPGSGPAISADRMTSYLVYHGEYSGALATKVADLHVVNRRADAVMAGAGDTAR